MKKILYLIPLLLLCMSALPVSLYKDKVDLAVAKNPDISSFEDLSELFTKLDPGHWKFIEYQASASGSFSGSIDFSEELPEGTEENQPSVQPEQKPLHEVAKFRGFPFAAYFSTSSTANTQTSLSSFTASGYSWLWILIDLILIIGSLVVAIILNRKKKTPVIPNSQTFTQTNYVNQQEPATTIKPTSPEPPQAVQQPQGQVVSHQPRPENTDNQNNTNG